MRLYDLTGKYKQLMDMEEDLDPTLFHDTLDSIDDAIEEKAINYGRIIKMLNADSKTIDDEIKVLQQRKHTIDNKSKLMKDTLTTAMIDTSKQKIKSPLISVWIQKNPAHVVIPDEKQLQADYFKVTRVPDTKQIAEDLKSGKEILGASLEQSESVRIR